MINPITNLEKLLSGDESVKPVTRIEQIVKGLDVKPLTHFEQIVCGWDIPPQNRLEQIIKGLDVGGYRSREEYFWGEWASGHGEIEYVGSVPFSVIAKGGNVSAYQIWGNTPYQEHTPSPDNPCEVKGVGERTANLFDYTRTNGIIDNRYINQNGETITANDYYISYPINVIKGETYTWRFHTSTIINHNAPTIAFYDKDNNFLGVAKHSLSIKFFSFVIPDKCDYIRCSVYKTDRLYKEAILNEGSEPLPYEPYGYKTTVVDEGKNLWDKSLVKNLWLSTRYTLDYDNGSRGVILPIYTKPRSRYILKYDSDEPYITCIGFLDKNRKPIEGTRSVNVSDKQVLSAAQSEDAAYIYAGIYLVGENAKNIQLELGTEATPYVPYREPIETTIYHDEPYFINDYIRKDKDGGVEHREWYKQVITPLTYKVIQADTRGCLFYIAGLPRAVVGTAYSDMLKHITAYPWSELYPNSVYTNGATLYISLTTDVNSVDKLNDILEKTPITVWYQLVTPTDTPKDLPEILLLNGYNGIDTDTEIKPEKMSITYKATKERAEYDLQLTNNLLDVMKGM